MFTAFVIWCIGAMFTMGLFDNPTNRFYRFYVSLLFWPFTLGIFIRDAILNEH